MTEEKGDTGMTENNGNSLKMNIGLMSVMLLLIINIAVGAFGYGRTSQQVQFNRELIQAYQNNQISIMAKLDDQSTRITKLEARLESLVLQIKE